MALKDTKDFEVQAKGLLDKIERYRTTYGMSGDQFIQVVASELHNTWLDAYNDSVLDHTPKTNKKKGNE